MVRVIIYTCNDYADALPAFAYLFNTYWSSLQPVAYAGCAKLDLPANFQWYEIESRIAARWSDGLIEFLNLLDDDIVAWMLEDYALCRTVQHGAIESLAEYMRMYDNIMRIDLTADRLHSGGATDIGYWGHCDLIETGWHIPYQFSTQAALWNRKHLLDLLRPEMSPWDFELQDKRPNLRVLGTRQWPVRYVNFYGMGLGKDEYRTEHIRHGLGGTTIERIPQEHVDFMRDHDLLPKDRKLNNDASR